MLPIAARSHGIVYVRVSTQHQADDELPIDSQVAELSAAVAAAGATCEVVSDAGISGTDLEGRAGLQSITARARDPKPGFEWVLVWKFSRFARNMEEGLVYRALLRKRGIELVSFKEPVPEGPLGQLITHILMAIDEFYAAATAADVLRSQKELTRQGFSAGGRPPVGYRRDVNVVGTRYGGAPLTRVRWVPDAETGPRVVQAFQMAATGATYDDIVAATTICRNKSSLATILANPIYRGLRVFNRETRVEGEHGRKRKRNAEDQHVTSAVEPLIPEELWGKVQVRLRAARENRLPPQRYVGGYLLTELLRCSCGGPMAGHSGGPRRYYRCTAKCGQPLVRAEKAENEVVSKVRNVLTRPESVRATIQTMNEAAAAANAGRKPAVAAGKAEVRRLEREEANLRDALRLARGSAMTALVAELEVVGDQLAAARSRLEAVSELVPYAPMTDAIVNETAATLKDLFESATFAEKVGWLRSAIERIDVDPPTAGKPDTTGNIVWRSGDLEAVSRSNDVYEWLRR
jgi:site-specific DNA recombinase